MDTFSFITVRLGKDSISDIEKLCSSNVGVLETSFQINVKCTQVPDNYKKGDYAFLWLGSDNNKGTPTKWKQGFKAVGRVDNISRGKSFNDTSETIIKILYVFPESINRMDILRNAPVAYYWCSSMPLIGLDDHANQTIRSMTGTAFSDLRAFFTAIELVTKRFKNDIIQVEPMFAQYFDVVLPNPQQYPLAKSINELGFTTNIEKKKSLQQIYYGAPGTGKSYEIKELTKGKHVIRTTFHPDSDYSTFVGAYKPTTIEVPMRDVTGKVIIENGQTVTENRIVYEFVEQAFLQSYTKAWKQFAKAEKGIKPEEVYLVIEEINRGNCAQIFGDLFQLLDRGDNGFSEYPIVADKDLQKQLAKAFEDMAFLNAPAMCGMSGEETAVKIRKGEILLLPNNLYIWATMNTSDQSLFPIDSAFKRRWDWQYIPISDGKKRWMIEVNGKQYDWWQFLEKINEQIGSTTNSEDKKLGYYFCKATNGIINAETFVGKVIFYLWNDVFKDFTEEAGELFKDDNGILSFNKFYYVEVDGRTEVVKERVTLFLENLGLEPIKDTNFEKENDKDDSTIQNDNLSGNLLVEWDGNVIKEKKSIDTFAKVIEMIGPARIVPLGLTVGRARYDLLSLTRIPTDVDGGYGVNLRQIDGYWMLTKYSNDKKVNYLQKIAKELNLDLRARLV